MILYDGVPGDFQVLKETFFDGYGYSSTAGLEGKNIGRWESSWCLLQFWTCVAMATSLDLSPPGCATPVSKSQRRHGISPPPISLSLIDAALMSRRGHLLFRPKNGLIVISSNQFHGAVALASVTGQGLDILVAHAVTAKHNHFIITSPPPTDRLGFALSRTEVNRDWFTAALTSSRQTLLASLSPYSG